MGPGEYKAAILILLFWAWVIRIVPFWTVKGILTIMFCMVATAMLQRAMGY